MSPLYIQSVSCISAQHSFMTDGLPDEVVSSNNNRLQCIEPDFTKFINPVQIRRMSRALKIGFASAIQCLRQMPELIPEAIIIGTGKGCLTDTEQFLHSIREYHETALNATHFIHSTYNQLNGMISLNQKINSYNVTYVHRAFSFEHSLMDAALLFDEGELSTALIGTFDEMTTEHFSVKQHWGYWKKELIASNELFQHDSSGTISGEGAAFFMLGKNKLNDKSIAIKHVSTLFRPSLPDVEHELMHLLAVNSLQADDIDLVLTGENGDANFESSYQAFHQLLPTSQVLYFKHLCGEYDTATSFACWLAHKLLTHQQIPDYLYHPLQKKSTTSKSIRNLLIFNNYFGVNQTMILMGLE